MRWKRQDMNPVFAVLDEIALEGLDGITFEALELRLKRRWNPVTNGNGSPLFKEDPENPQHPTSNVNEKIRSFLWAVIRSKDEIGVFQLPEDRPPLVIFDRFEHIDSELGMIIEPDVLPRDIYPFQLVEDGEIKGSCQTYKERRDVTEAAKAYCEVEALLEAYEGQARLAFVASQWARAKALMGPNPDPLLVQTVSGMPWAILERIGRARELGEVTQGKMSLQFTKENPKTLFYHRKALIKESLIQKQVHYQKTKGQNYQASSGSLFHLTRFFVERRSKALILIHSLIKYLKEKDSHMAPYDEVRSYLNIGTSVKKLFKHTVFQRFIRGDIRVPYRALYPDATDLEWKSKNKSPNDERPLQDKEKQVRVVQLINPEVDPESVWQDVRDEMDEDDEDLEAGFIDQSKWKLTRSMMHQAYSLLEAMGPRGLSQQELGVQLGLGKLEARTICRNLERRNLVTILLHDQGRQRTTSFVAKKFEHLSVVSSEMEKEKKKLASLKAQGAPSSSASVSPIPDTPTVVQPQKILKSEPGYPIRERSSVDKSSTNVEISLGTAHIKIPGKKSPTKELKPNRSSLKKNPDQSLTFRQLRRSTSIIEAVRQHKVIDDPTKLYKMIQENEVNEGYEARMDKKSLLRLLVKLHDEGQIKNILVKMNCGDRFKTLHFVCEPNIHENHTVIQSAVEQAKMKFNIIPKLIKPEIKRCGGPGTEEFQGGSIGESGWTKGWCLMCDVLLRLPLSVFVQLVNITTFVEGLSELLEHPIRKHLPVRSLSVPMRNKLLARRKYIFTVHEVATRLCYIGVLQFGPQKLKEKDQVFLYLNKQASLINTTSCSPSYHRVVYQDEVDYPVNRYLFIKWENAEKYWFDMYEICMNTPLGSSSSVQGEEIILEKMDKKPALLTAQSPKKCGEAIEYDNATIPGDHLGAGGLDSSMFAHLKRNWSWTTSNNARPKIDPGSQADKKYSFPSMTAKLNVNFANNSAKSSPTPRKPVKRRKHQEGDGKASKSKAKSEVDLAKAKPTRSTSHVVKRVIKPRVKNTERRPYYDEVDKSALRLMRKLRVDWSAQEDSFLLLCKVAGSYLCKNSRNQMVQYTWVRDLLHRHFEESLNKTSHACQRRLNYMMKNPTTASNVTLFLADLHQDHEIVGQFVVPLNGVLTREENDTRLARDFEPLVEKLVEKYRNSTSRQTQIKLPDTLEELNAKYTIVNPPISMAEACKTFTDPQDINDIRASVINALITSSLCSATDKVNVAFQLFKIYQQYPDSLIRRVMTKLRTDKMASGIPFFLLSKFCSLTWFTIFPQVSLKKHFNKSRLKHGNFLPLNASPYQLSVSFAHKFLNRYQHDIYEQSWIMTRKILENEVKHQTGEKASTRPGIWFALLHLIFPLLPGTEVVINQEGGYAAAILALMGKQKLTFRTEVPEQLVVLDPNLSLVDHQYVRILQRYRELLKVSGSSEVETFEFSERSNDEGESSSAQWQAFGGGNKKDLTVTDLFRKTDSLLKSSSPSKRTATVLVESMSKRAKLDVHDVQDPKPESEIVFRENESSPSMSVDDVSNSKVAKSASRIALYMMREEIKDSSNPNVQHSHDFFVISSCAIEIRMKPSMVEDGGTVSFGSHGTQMVVPKSLLPGNSDACRDILQSYGMRLNGTANQGTLKMNQSIIPPSMPSLSDCLSESNLSEVDQITVTSLFNLVVSKKEFGATAQDILDLDMPFLDSAKETCLRFLLDRRQVLMVGVVTVRFVTHNQAQPWLLHSYRTTRTSFTERREPPPSAILDTQSQTTVRTSDLKHGVRNPKASNEVAEAAEKVDWTKVEEIHIRLRPWLRIDGLLNRRVLDRLLGAVLGQIMQFPGETLTMVFNRFTPALQPVHIKDLLLILERLECVTVGRLVKTGQLGLFRVKPTISVTNGSILLDNDNEVFIEPTVDAVVRLGQFIGDKQYTVDFVGHCSCHPEKRL
eukprot:TCALIF_09445-PA protein Name:"Similar to Gtf3c1 General transcription factor 3C polypeptide 1 (Rattus norvegicus)" AED:0.03 eAED:0.04 QI:37/0.71/0.62/1/0.85/0.87/8/0/1945